MSVSPLAALPTQLLQSPWNRDGQPFGRTCIALLGHPHARHRHHWNTLQVALRQCMRMVRVRRKWLSSCPLDRPLPSNPCKPLNPWHSQLIARAITALKLPVVMIHHMRTSIWMLRSRGSCNHRRCYILVVMLMVVTSRGLPKRQSRCQQDSLQASMMMYMVHQCCGALQRMV